MKDSDIIVLQEPKLSLADQFYLPQVLIGLGTTMKHMLHVLAGKDRVIQYPEETREDMPIEEGGMHLRTYRGVHRLNKDEEGRVKCVACFMCSTACPARAFTSKARESPWAGSREISRQVRHRRAPLHLLRHVRRSLPGRCDRADPHLRHRRPDPAGNDLRQREAAAGVRRDGEGRADVRRN